MCQIIRLSKTVEINWFLLVYIYNHYLIVIVSWGIVATMKHTYKMPNNLLYRGQIDYKRHGHKSQTIRTLWNFIRGQECDFIFKIFHFIFFMRFKKKLLFLSIYVLKFKSCFKNSWKEKHWTLNTNE